MADVKWIKISTYMFDNPEKYLNYGNEPKRTDTEHIDVLEATTDDIILMMADLIGGEA